MTFGVLVLCLFSQSDVLTTLEQRLVTAFDEDTYRRYLYYCRQQDQGSRLVETSSELLSNYPDREILNLGRAEGLMMCGRNDESFKALKELYGKSPQWGSDIIFTLNELESDYVVWFITEERKRTSNPTLHASTMVGFYLRQARNEKALEEVADALEAGADSKVFSKQIKTLSERLGPRKVSAKLRTNKGSSAFETALQLGDTLFLFSIIENTNDSGELASIGRKAEEKKMYDVALEAYEKAGENIGAARMIHALGDTKKAKELLGKDTSIQSKTELVFILSESKATYQEAIKTLYEIEEARGISAWTRVRVSALELLRGNREKSGELLKGVPEDSSSLLLKGILAAVDGETDTLKLYMESLLIRYPGNSLENDLVLLYKIALTTPQDASDYAMALAALRWGDAEDALSFSSQIQKRSKEAADEALLLMAQSLAKLRRYREADEAYSKISTDCPESSLAPRAKFERAILLRDRMNDPGKAKDILEEIILRNPASLYADLARHEIQ